MIQSGGDREFANVLMAPAGPGQPPQDVAVLISTSGWAKVRDGVGEGDEAVRRLGAEEAKRRESLRGAESQAQAEGKGLWSENPENVCGTVPKQSEAEGRELNGCQQRLVSFQMPADPHAFIAEHKDREIDGEFRKTGECSLHVAIVEQVRDGTQLRVRLLLDDQQHQFINLVRLSMTVWRVWLINRSWLVPRVPGPVDETTLLPLNHTEKR